MLTHTIDHVKEATFESMVLSSETPVVVDFWAPWCPPCLKLNPIVEELSAEYNGAVRFTKMNTDENENTMIEYGVTSLPTMIIFKDGEEVNRLIGFTPKDNLRRQIDRSI